MAEAVFKEKVKQAGLEDKIAVSSAATGSWNLGDPPHEGTRRILDAKKIDYSGIESTKITKEDFSEYDYIIGMDENNMKDLEGLSPKVVWLEKVYLFLKDVPNSATQEVPDPYYTGDFELTYDLIDKGTDYWLNHMIDKLKEKNA